MKNQRQPGLLGLLDSFRQSFTGRPRPTRRGPASRTLHLEPLESRDVLTAPAISVLAPPANSHTAPVSVNVQATFDQPLNPATVTDQSFVIHGMQSGRLRTVEGDSFAPSGATVTVNPVF